MNTDIDDGHAQKYSKKESWLWNIKMELNKAKNLPFNATMFFHSYQNKLSYKILFSLPASNLTACVGIFFVHGTGSS